MTREPAITERQNMERIADLARPLGWKIKHDRPGMTVRGHRTAVTYDGQGWPDLFMVHPASGDCLARELKTWARRKELGPGQAAWLDWLWCAGIDAGQDEPDRDQPVGVWTERDWSDIIVPRIMRHTAAAVTGTFSIVEPQVWPLDFRTHTT